MAAKREIQDIDKALPPRKRRSSRKASQNEKPTPVSHPPQPTRGPIQERSQGTSYSSSVVRNLWHEVFDRALSEKRNEVGAKHESLEEEDQTNSVREDNQPGVLPLTKESLRLLDHSNRSRQSLSMPSTETESRADTDTSGASVSAYEEDYKTCLEDRSIYLQRGKRTPPPSNLDSVRDAIFNVEKVPKPPEDQARFVRDLCEEVRGEPDVVLQLLPEFVPLAQIRKDRGKKIVTDAFWRRCLSVDPEMKPSLKIPKPDVTIGWDAAVFPFKKAKRNLQAFQCPVASSSELSWPLFTVEAKGERGCLRVAQLQNLYSASIMLSNLRELTKAARREDEFFNKIHVMTLEITTDIVQLSYYWATRSESGEIFYYGNVFATWTPKSHRDTDFVEAHQCISNAINLVTENAFQLVNECMETVEKILNTTSLTNISPPRTLTKTSGVRKPRGKKAFTSTTQSSSASWVSKASANEPTGSIPKETTTDREEPRAKSAVVAENPTSSSSIVSLATYVIQSINPFRRR